MTLSDSALSTTPALPAVDLDFTAIIARLEQLSRDHQLLFQLEVGRAVLDDCFGGDPSAYLSRDPAKPARFTAFIEAAAERLDDLGLGGGALRRCVVMRIVYDSLPAELTSGLRISHYVELAKVDDVETRRLLAEASVENAWNAAQLKDAVTAVRQGRWIDGSPDVPGLQPPAPLTETPRKIQPGRVVSRVERAAEDFGALATDWEQVAVGKLTGEQRRRLGDAVTALEARVAALRRSLGS